MSGFDIGYRFVNYVRFGYIINDKEIRPTYRPDIPEVKAIFIVHYLKNL